MNQTLSTWSIRNPIPTIVIFLVIFLLGLSAFPSLGVDENPNMDLPALSIVVLQHGANPSELETQVTKHIEDAVSSLENIEDLISTVGDGVSQTTLNLSIGTDVDRALTDARNAVEKIRDKLPQNLDEIIVQRIDYVGTPFATNTVSSDSRSIEELSWLLDNQISKELLAVPGIARVERAGGVSSEIEVELDPTRLRAVGLNASMVNAQLLSNHTNLPSGRSDVSSQEHSIRVLGQTGSLDGLRNMEVLLPGGAAVPVSSLGRVTEGAADQRQSALLDGQPVVSFSVSKNKGSDLVGVANACELKLKELKDRLPPDIKIERIRTNVNYVRDSYNASVEAFWLGAILSVIVIWLFLKDLRATLISSLAIPLSVVPTFFVMKALGYSLNNMSLLGLALVIGILVDDAIVEIENVVRHMSLGKPAFEAATDASNEIGLAVIATSFALIVVFAPVGFMGGIAGQFFKQFGITIAVAVFFSLMVARMLTPMLAAYFMKSSHGGDQQDHLTDLNDYVLAWALDHRFLTIAGAVLISVLSALLLNLLPKSLINSADKGEVQVMAELAPGTTLGQTEAAVRRMTNLFLAHSEVSHVFAHIGSNEYSRATNLGDSAPNNAALYLSLKPRNERHLSQQEIEHLIHEDLKSVPGLRACFNHATTFGNSPLMVVLSSRDESTLLGNSEAMVSQLKAVRGVFDIKSNLPIMKPGLVVRPDIRRAAEHGITAQAISEAAMTAMIGENDARLARFSLPDRQVNICVKLKKEDSSELSTIENLQIRGADGKMIPLVSVADISFQSSPSVINRYAREREVTICGDCDSTITLGTALDRLGQLPACKDLPSHVRVTPIGDVKLQANIFNGFSWSISIACLLKYAVLAVLFGNFLHPLTILMSLPLSLCGALLGLVVGHQSVGLYALIGILMLIGLVTKNSILLVDYAIELMKRGCDARMAIAEANRVRMRPITMTTVAMVAGMLPIAVGLGAGAEVRAPMAIAVVGGLMTSNFFTLLVVPVVFTLVHDFQKWLGSLRSSPLFCRTEIRRARFKPLQHIEE